MKVLKIIGIVLAAIVLIIVILAFVAPTEVSYEKSVSIDAPLDVVWDNVNSMEDMNSWSPWVGKDPSMKQELTGESGAVGQKHSWESDAEDVGSGSQTITKLEAPTLIETQLKFYDPYESEAKAYVRLEEGAEGTTATWGFSSEMPRPMNIMMLMTSMEEMIGPDYEDGLNRLKNMSEEDKAEMEKQMMMDALESDSTAME